MRHRLRTLAGCQRDVRDAAVLDSPHVWRTDAGVTRQRIAMAHLPVGMHMA